ncbi:MAG TPA: hypothetical protein VNV65_01360 [Candidatus Solibacter sp.]|nr:hypothetical protein [Candidatus Solibacter sp.]
MRTEPLRLRPLQISELLDETFRIYRGNFLLFAGVSLALALPGLVLNLLTGNYKVFGLFFSAFSDPNTFEHSGFGSDFNVTYLLAGYALILLVVPLTAGANIQAAIDVATARPTSIGAVFARVLRRYFGIYGVVAMGFLMGIVMITIVLIPLVIWILVSWSVAVVVLLLEGARPIASLRRSRALVRGHWWRLFGILVVTYFLAAVISSGVGALAGGIAALAPGLSADVRGAVLLLALALTSAMTQPVFPIVITLMYFDLRVRNEALDLDVLVQKARAESETLPPPLPPPFPSPSRPSPSQPEAGGGY